MLHLTAKETLLNLERRSSHHGESELVEHMMSPRQDVFHAERRQDTDCGTMVRPDLVPAGKLLEGDSIAICCSHVYNSKRYGCEGGDSELTDDQRGQVRELVSKKCQQHLCVQTVYELAIASWQHSFFNRVWYLQPMLSFPSKGSFSLSHVPRDPTSNTSRTVSYSFSSNLTLIPGTYLTYEPKRPLRFSVVSQGTATSTR